jgi:ABC-type Zn uptake system ZnuABC Zn-binding protein ZnuA
MCFLKPHLFMLAVAVALCMGPAEANAEEPLAVVVTLPVLKDLAEQVGGPHVRVTSLMSGLESEHTYSPRPSDLIAVRSARVLLEIGLGLEIWVTALVRTSGNERLKIVTTSHGIPLIRDHEPETSAARPGHAHPGNPHVWLDPENVKVMISHITDAFVEVAPGHAGAFRQNQAAYLRKLDSLQTELAQRLKAVPDRRLVVYHPAWPYFARRFGFEVVGEIVPQFGAEPSARRLQALIGQIRRDRLRVIVSEPQANPRIPEVLARESGARVVVLTVLPGALAGPETYLDMVRYNVLQLAAALEAA